MTTNLVELIQKNLRYPALQKVDPNSQDIQHRSADPLALLAQAAIPAVLTGLYKLSRNDAGSTRVMVADRIEDTLGVIFEGKENQLVEKVAHYADVSVNQAESHLENISDESIRLVKELLPGKKEAQQLKHFMNDQRHNILVYLPADLHMGDLLQDDTLDDRTNKMEGPVSNFMHKIENLLSQGGS